VQQVFAGDRPLLAEGGGFFLANFGVGGKQDDLVAGLGKVALDEVLAVRCIEATEGCIDGDGQGATAGPGQSPKEGDRQKLLFSGGEAMLGQRVSGCVEECEPKGVGIILDPKTGE